MAGEQRQKLGGVLLAAVWAVVFGLIARLLLLVTLRYETGRGMAAILAGHDGGEYLAYAKHLSGFSFRDIPFDARRHDAGWPILLAVFSWAGPGWAVALGLIWACFAGTIFCTAKLLRDATATDTCTIGLICAALAIAYPANLYYHCFAMTESAFLLGVILSMLLYVREYRVAAYLITGLASTIRGPGILLAVSFAASDILKREKIARLLPAAMALIAPLAIWILSVHLWGESVLSVHNPEFGYPFSGFNGVAHFGIFRAAYIFFCVAFFLIGIGRVSLEAKRSAWRNPFVNSAALFGISFLLFHLCLKSLRYLGSPVYSFNYQDRYLIGILPIALYGFRTLLKPWIVMSAGVASVALSAYWGHNYFLSLSELNR